MIPNELAAYNRVLNRLEQKQAQDNSIVGIVNNLDESLISDLTLLSDRALTSGSYEFDIGGENQDIVTIDGIKLAHYMFNFKIDLIEEHSTGSYIITSNWEKLLKNEDFVISARGAVLLTDDCTLLTGETGNNLFNNYQKITNVHKLITSLASESEGSNKTIFYDRPISFHFILHESDLSHDIDFDAITSLINKDLHKEAIVCIVCKELVNFLKDIDSKKRFSYLIQHLSSLSANILLNYKSYVDEYSFDKVRKEYNEKKTEYVERVHSIFDNAATKLLSIPAGVWFATTQITNSQLGTLEFTKNIIVLITVSILVFLLVLMLHGQFSTIRVLQDEYTQLFKRLKVDYPDEVEQIISIETDLASKAWQVELKLWLAICSSLTLAGLTLWLFCTSYN